MFKVLIFFLGWTHFCMWIAFGIYFLLLPKQAHLGTLKFCNVYQILCIWAYRNVYMFSAEFLPLSVVWIKYILISILGWQHEKSRNKVIAFIHDMLSANSGLYRVAKSDIFNIFNIVIKMNWMYTNYTNRKHFSIQYILKHLSYILKNMLAVF